MMKKYVNGILLDLTEEDKATIEKDAEDDLVKLPERQKEWIRNTREPLLKEADIEIFKLEDSGGDTSAWRTYRQQLRDMTNQSDLANPVYPTKPS
jgi:hypothetical protein